MYQKYYVHVEEVSFSSYTKKWSRKGPPTLSNKSRKANALFNRGIGRSFFIVCVVVVCSPVRGGFYVYHLLLFSFYAVKCIHLHILLQCRRKELFFALLLSSFFIVIFQVVFSAQIHLFHQQKTGTSLVYPGHIVWYQEESLFCIIWLAKVLSLSLSQLSIIQKSLFWVWRERQ